MLRRYPELLLAFVCVGALTVLSLLVVKVAQADGCLSLSVDGIAQPCGQARPADAFSADRTRSWLYSGLDLTGSLMTPSGSPSVGTMVTVTQTAPDGTDAVQVASGVTDSAGRYSIRVGRGESRLLAVAAAGDEIMVRETVDPNVFLQVHARRDGLMVFWGRVLTDDLAAAPTVELQDFSPSGWQTFDYATVTASRFRTVYRPPAGASRLDLKWRAVTTPTVAWAAGASGDHWVAIR